MRDLGEPPKSEVNLLLLAKEDRRAGSRFSLRESRGGVGVLDANGFMLRTGMAAIARGTRGSAGGEASGREWSRDGVATTGRLLAVKNGDEEIAQD